jgi:hypothetical protein
MNRIASKQNPYSILSKSYNLKEGVVKINTHNHIIHEVAKFIVAYNLKKAGEKVYTEAIFNNNKRADIYLPEKSKIVEILYSESTEEFLKKIKEYPTECEINKLKAEGVLNYFIVEHIELLK